MPLVGGCLCGSVRYEADQLASPIGHCHCRTCRKANANAYTSTARVVRGAFRFTAGEEKLSAFEGRSKFRTWAVTIAVRTAISKMRKREWQNVSLESMAADGKFDPQVVVDTCATSDQESGRSMMLNKLL